ncbi:MAG: Beta-glucosidase [Gemmatimonadetes bacterium]|nr:Beta-glucosidase [Gemmatimonadota bacterium]
MMRHCKPFSVHALTARRTRAVFCWVLGAFLIAVPATAHAQYLFEYSVWQNYVPVADGRPFSGLLCTGTTAVINYDNNPLTGNPKISDWCPAVGLGGENFGAQFSAELFAPVSGIFQFYLGSDDGSSLFIDGINVLSLIGEQPFTSGLAYVPFDAGTTHTYFMNYYANGQGGSAVQAMVDNRLDVFQPSDLESSNVGIVPEPSSLVLTASGLLALVLARRRKQRPSPDLSS